MLNIPNGKYDFNKLIMKIESVVFIFIIEILFYDLKKLI